MDVHVLHELERIGWPFEWASESNVKCRCPFHDDASPSCSIEIKQQVFRCHAGGCGMKGDFVTFLAGALRVERSTVVVDLAKRYGHTDDKPLDPGQIERWHSDIWSATPLLAALYERALTDEDIRTHRLGCDGERVTIPIKNEAGVFVNVRKYLPGAPGKDKMRNMRSRGRPRPFPVDQLKYDELVLVGGECKAIVAARLLNPHNIGAFTIAAGEGSWDPAVLSVLKGKSKLWVLMDVDEGGRRASIKYCRMLHRVVGWISDVILPLDVETHPHGDVNDFVALGGDLYDVVQAGVEFTPPSDDRMLEDVDPINVTLVEAVDASSASRRVNVRAVVAAIDTSPYVVPSRVLVECTRDQAVCALCPVFSGGDEYDVHPESPAILEMAAHARSAQDPALRATIGIPIVCKVVQFRALTYHNVEECRVSPQLEITSRVADRVLQPAMIVSSGVELNESYDLIGRMWPHPATQQSTLLFSKVARAQDALSSYHVNGCSQLLKFRPSEWSVEAVREKLLHIYADLETNVTRIWQRRELHLAVDLAYHSPLFVDFDGKRVKGWTEVLCVGDTAQGKSETARCLMDHYGLGEWVECKNATVAGLLGGVQQMGGGRFFVTWGVIPTNDRRLVILEELKGASPEVISKLTDMRSSGVATLPKIEKRKTHARTRLFVTSNPRSDVAVSAYNFGVEAIMELVGAPEDVRRFDLCLVLASDEVDHTVINARVADRPVVTHAYDAASCRELILWAWTAESATYDDDAARLVLESASALSDEFTDQVPLLDHGSARYKLARLAAALAGRTFSSSDDNTHVRVRRCHVEFIVELIRKLYSSRSCGYADFTEAVRATTDLQGEDEIVERIHSLSFPVDFVTQMLHASRVDAQDIQDWCAYDRVAAQQLVSFLVRRRALTREDRGYRKTSPFVTLLKRVRDAGTLENRPDYIREEF